MKLLKALIVVFFVTNLLAEIRLPSMKPEHVLNIVRFYLPQNPVILDAGAFDGAEDIPLFKRIWPEARIYAFEPVPDIYQRLLKNVEPYSNIFCSSYALSDKIGQAEFTVSEEPNKSNISSMSSSLLAPKEHLKYSTTVFPKKIMVETITLDTWAEENKVDKIDFLWLDLQGYELNVLKAAPNILKTVKVIYTEVEFVEAYQNQYLFKDINDWLHANGFRRIARDFDWPATRDWFGNAIYVRE